jgi:hypothetical protein
MVEGETVLNTFVEGKLGFVGNVDILFALNTQDLVFVVNLSMHNAVTEGFGDDEFYILGRDIEFVSDVSEGNLAIGDRDTSTADSDDDLVQSEDDIVKLIPLEGILVLFYHIMEAFEFPFQHNLNQLVVRVGVLEVQVIRKYLSIGNLPL